MNLDQVIVQILNPGLAQLPLAMDTPKARVLMLAIGLQESEFEHRAQVLNGGGKGPARGLWQFERGGGVKGVMNHHATTGHAHRLCAERGVDWDSATIWAKLETDDLLACGFARLLLFSDPRPLPALDDVDAAWELYAERTWKPGKPHPEKWPGNHAAACRALGVLHG
ncbi:hypothetical protein C7T35_15500 [Variovorax sp. WS11]|uniref:hypothetical protein n=1 Tax=Variovorax sp. WS11 TaxID=1105204 RepID=UPI000D0DDC45|nr:hypothetical protein [Variovorax sp. WS11]NDZ12032.1 hypothetical protein [Variovorax sp. WS11]PSL83783.1 hypothetical protein C7T35_15500 [Variovorax sp. WS11]